MANPEAGGDVEAIQNALQVNESQEEEDDNQAAMIAEMAGMQMGADHGPMTQQEMDDMRMAAQL